MGTPGHADGGPYDDSWGLAVYDLTGQALLRAPLAGQEPYYTAYWQ